MKKELFKSSYSYQLSLLKNVINVINFKTVQQQERIQEEEL